MFRFAALASLLFSAACSSTTPRAERPSEPARQEAAGPSRGCLDTVEIGTRRCRAATERASERVEGQIGARSAKSDATKRETSITDDASEASTFPRDDARTALRAAEGGLRSCNESAVPRTVDVTMTFEPSGNVSAVEVSPSGGRAASCVEGRLREVAVAPFQGQPVTIRTPLTL